MPASNLVKGLTIAGALIAGAAIAQGTPPTPASDPAVGAGQQSTQATPMGTTGTAAAADANATGNSTMGSSTGSSSMGSTSGATASSASMDTSASSSTRPARADRN